MTPNPAVFVGTPTSARSSGLSAVVPALVFVAFLVAIAYVGWGWVWLSHPNSTIPASAYKILFVREALRSNAQFRCTPEKSSCSAMTSCAEAFFHQEKCGVPAWTETAMEYLANGDGATET